MRVKPGGTAVVVPKAAEPGTVEQPAPFKPGPESATGWSSAFRALRDATGAGFSQLVRASGLGQALSALKETWQPPSERAEAITLLVEHVETLSIEQRSDLITEIQKSPLGSKGAAAATKVLLATKGTELTALKNLIEGGHDLFNLDALVFETFEPSQRAQVLDHFAKEAVPTLEQKLLSDIDDTVYASVNDPRFAKGQVYPGVEAFYAALDSGKSGHRKGDVLFLTARPPKEAGGTIGHLTKLGFDTPTVLTGGLSTYLRRMLSPTGHEQLAYPGMGMRKIENFERHEQLFPEYGYVFVGDNGQGDVLAGRGMLEKHPNRMSGVFIHEIQPRTDALSDGIGYFHTYVGAAALALKAGLITKDGAAQVAAAALQQAETVQLKDDAGKATYLAQLREDLKALDALM